MYETARDRQQTVNRPFKWVLIGSLLLHFGAAGAVVYAQSRNPKPAVRSSIPVELVKLGKPRDPKLLPRKVRSAPPPPPDDAVALDTGKDTPKPKKKPRRREKKPELSDAARRLLESSSSEAALDDALAKIEDPEGSPDGFAEGTTTDPSKAARGYEATVAASLKRAYKLPELLKSQRQFLSARVVVYIAPNGRISRYEVVKKHPNQLFMSVLEGLLTNHQLPPPPNPTLARKYGSEGLDIIFKP